MYNENKNEIQNLKIHSFIFKTRIHSNEQVESGGKTEQRWLKAAVMSTLDKFILAI